MKIFSKELGTVATNVFVVWDKKSKEALVIDAPEGAFQAAKEFVQNNNLTIKGLLLTHGHWDHIADAHFFQKTGIITYAHKGDMMFYKTPMLMRVTMPFGLNIDPVPIDHWVEEGDNISLLSKSIEVRHVPGHAPGNILFYFKKDRAVFVGDAIFAGSIGRYDFPGCSFEELESSIKKKIYTLPDDTVIYPGHGCNTTVGVEKTHNPYVRG